MSLYWQIKTLYPDISDHEFAIQNDSDGKGAYIKEWKLSKSKPTKDELLAVKDLADIKLKFVEFDYFWIDFKNPFLTAFN